MTSEEMKKTANSIKHYEDLDKETQNTIKYTENMNSDNVMIRVLTTHIVTEYLINEIIKNNFINPKEIIDDDKFTYASKLKIIYGMELIDEDLSKNLKRLNKIRNAYAHNLNPEIKPFSYKGFVIEKYLDSDDTFTIEEIKQQNFKNITEHDNFIKDFCYCVLITFRDHFENKLKLIVHYEFFVS